MPWQDTHEPHSHAPFLTSRWLFRYRSVSGTCYKSVRAQDPLGFLKMVLWIILDVIVGDTWRNLGSSFPL